MTLDLSKLTPAPWDVQLNREHPTAPLCVIREGEGGVFVSQWLCHEQTPDAEAAMVLSVEANTEFVALARNAFDVLMRRGWSATKVKDERSGTLFSDHKWRVWMPHGWSSGYDNPFTALVEADRWYRENVENPCK